jgi:hypothetical protein
VSADPDLLARYSPYVQYDSLESFAADSVATMTDCVPTGYPHGNALRQDGEKLAEVVPAAGEEKLELELLRAKRHADPAKTPASGGDYLDVVGKDYVKGAREMHTRPGYADQVYGHAKRDRNGDRADDREASRLTRDSTLAPCVRQLTYGRPSP